MEISEKARKQVEKTIRSHWEPWLVALKSSCETLLDEFKEDIDKWYREEVEEVLGRVNLELNLILNNKKNDKKHTDW